jgi:thiol-disulfide isomerase/thioredoxin
MRSGYASIEDIVDTWGFAVVVVVLIAATLFGLHRRRNDGRLRHHMPTGPKEQPADRLGPDEIGAALGQRATLVQFSTAFCQPCRATRRLLDEVTGMVEGVAHVEIDAESRLDLVRQLGVMRTPTVLVLDGDGQVRRRASGLPRKADVIAALGEVI